jgi:hypothetical protein
VIPAFLNQRAGSLSDLSGTQTWMKSEYDLRYHEVELSVLLPGSLSWKILGRGGLPFDECNYLLECMVIETFSQAFWWPR